MWQWFSVILVHLKTMIEKFKDTEGIITSHDSEKGQTIQWEIDKGQTIICKTLYRKLNIEQNLPHKKLSVN